MVIVELIGIIKIEIDIILRSEHPVRLDHPMDTLATKASMQYRSIVQ